MCLINTQKLKTSMFIHYLDVLIEIFESSSWVTNLTQKLFLPKWISKIMCPINTQKYYLVIKLNNYGHFPQFFFLKVALFHLQSLWLFFLFKYYMSVVPVKYLHFRFRQKWNVDFTNGWNQGRPGSYLVNKLEIEVSSDLVGDFEAFFSVSLSSFLACYNWLQQLYINEQKQTIFQSCLLFK